MNNFSFSEDDMSLESSTSQHVNCQITQKPTMETTVKRNEVQCTQQILQTNELTLNSENHDELTRLHKRQHRPMLNISVNSISDYDDSSAEDNESISSDDNISEEQLFGSGQNRPYGSSENNAGASSDSQFTFSQATRHTGLFDFLFRFHSSYQTDSTNTSDDSELD